MDRIEVLFPDATGIPEIHQFHAPILLLGSANPVFQFMCMSVGNFFVPVNA